MESSLHSGGNGAKDVWSIPDLIFIDVHLVLAEVEVGKDQEFTVKSKGAGGQGKVAAKITGPSTKPVPCKVEPGLSSDNSVVKFIPREEGPYEVDVTYDGVPVPGSPFPVEAVPPTNPSKVRVPVLSGCLGKCCPFSPSHLKHSCSAKLDSTVLP